MTMKRLTTVILYVGICATMMAQIPSASSLSYPLPVVPDELQEPEQRLVYVLDHYWENYQWNDTTEVNQMVGEQGLVDFLDLLQYADSLTADRCATQFVRLAFATPWHRKHYTQLLDHYLYNPESPLRNDLVYAHLLRHVATPQALPDEAERQRQQFLLQQIDRNQVGSIAADVAYEDANGLRHHLHEVVAPLTLLLFTDPYCSDCQEAEERMKQEPLLQDDRLTIIRVLPYDIGNTYFIQFTPAFYLLDSDKRVIMKNAHLEQILQALQQQ